MDKHPKLQLKARLSKLKILLGLVLMSALYTCTKYKGEIYPPGREVVYLVTDSRYDSIYMVDTIRLKVAERNRFPQILSTQYTFYWIYSKPEIRTEKTGLVEDKYVYLHPPREDFMVFTQLASFPSITVRDSGFAESTTYRRIFWGYGEWDGKTIKTSQSYTLDSVHQVETPKLTFDSCYLVRGLTKESPLGRITTRFYFDRSYGFIKMKYFIHEENREVVMEAVEIN